MTSSRTAALLAAALLLGGCSASAPSTSPTTQPGSTTSTVPSAPSAADVAAVAKIVVTDKGDAAPTIALGGSPVTVGATTVKVRTEGTGPAAGEADAVDARIAFFNGRTGQMIEESYTTARKSVHLRLADPNLLQGLVIALTGLKEGTVAVAAIPPVDAFGAAGNYQAGLSGTDSIVATIDVRKVAPVLTGITGTMTQPAATLPQVAVGDASGPKITIPTGATPPTKTVIHSLVQGSGTTVQAGDQVYVNYTGVLWKDGSVFDSSFGKTPATFSVGLVSLGAQAQVISAWDTRLVGQKVGSRLLLVVPPADGYGTAGRPPQISGTDTLVFVVDLLDAG